MLCLPTSSRHTVNLNLSQVKKKNECNFPSIIVIMLQSFEMSNGLKGSCEIEKLFFNEVHY